MSRPESPSFQRAFVALNYVIGRRAAALVDGLPAAHNETQVVMRRLEHVERERRAETLAGELARITRSIEARSIK